MCQLYKAMYYLPMSSDWIQLEVTSKIKWCIVKDSLSQHTCRKQQICKLYKAMYYLLISSGCIGGFLSANRLNLKWCIIKGLFDLISAQL